MALCGTITTKINNKIKQYLIVGKGPGPVDPKIPQDSRLRIERNTEKAPHTNRCDIDGELPAMHFAGDQDTELLQLSGSKIKITISAHLPFLSKAEITAEINTGCSQCSIGICAG